MSRRRLYAHLVPAFTSGKMGARPSRPWMPRSCGAGSYEAPYYRACGADGSTISRHAFGPQMGTRMLTMTRQLLYQALLDEALAAGAEFRVDSRIVAAARRLASLPLTGRVFLPILRWARTASALPFAIL